MKKALIVQPHSDDVLFSCSHVLFGKGKQKFDSVEILTVENDKRRLQEDARLLEYFKKLKIYNLDVEFEDKSYSSYFKMHSEIDDAIVVDYLANHYGEKVLMEITEQLVNFVESWIDKHQDDEDIQCYVYCCLGIGHPFHRYIKLILEDYTDYYYRDWPHSYKKRNKADFEALTNNLKIAYEVDDKDMHQKKFDIAKQIYKSQSGLMFFEQGYIKKQLPEVIYKKL